MALLDSLYTINITSQTSSPSRPGFGVGLLAAYHTMNTDVVRTYTSLAAAVSDGFTSTAHPAAYAKIAAYFAQSPAPQKLKIGRRTTPVVQVQTVKVATPVTGRVLSVSLDGVTLSYTTLSSDTTTTTLATSFRAVIAAGLTANVSTAVASTDTITISSAATKLVNLINLSPAACTIANTSADPGLTADLTAFQTADQDWYEFTTVAGGAIESAAAAVWAEANGKVYVAHTADDVAATSATSDVISTFKTAAYGRTAPFFHRAGGTLSTIAAAVMGKTLTTDPGSDTWHMKTLAGVPADTLTDSEVTQLQLKRATIYVSAAGINFTDGGNVSSGEWADVVRGLDWLKATIQIDQFALFLNNKKIPFTELGSDMIKNTLSASLKAGQNAGLLSPDKPVIFAPAIADVSQVDKGARVFRGITWSAKLAGAIHSEIISGTVTL